jgi:hypothetical protein
MGTYTEVQPNRQYKDRLFRLLFGNEKYKDNLLVLYNALNHSNYENADDIEITTIDDVIYLGMKNDVAFIIDFYLSLYEQQSSFNPNMPLRGMFYFSDSYSRFITRGKYNIYGHKLIRIPTPRYVIFYNGDEKRADIEKLRLSDAFIHPDDSGEFEWTATLISLNPGQNEELLENCKPLREYAIFVNKIKEYTKKLSLADAVEKAVQECIEEGVLADFLRIHRAEVLDVCIKEFNEEVYRKGIWEEGAEEGFERGVKHGMERGRIEERAIVALRMLKTRKFPLDEIASLSGLSVDEIISLQESE